MPALATWLAPFGARAATPDDADFLAALYASTRPDLLGDGSADPLFAAQLIAMQQRLQVAAYAARFPRAETLLLEHDGAPCARIVVDSDAERVRLVDLALLPGQRGRGFGTQVLRSLQQWAGERALPLQLSVHHGNAGARRLYCALGFVSAGAGPTGEELVWRRSVSALTLI